MTNLPTIEADGKTGQQPSLVLRNGASIPETLADAQADAHKGSPRQQAESLQAMSHAATLPMEEEIEPGAPLCQRCEVMARKLVGPGLLHLSMPHTHTLGKVLAWLIDNHWPHTRREGTVTVTVPEGSLAPLITPLMALMASPEQRDARAVFQPHGHIMQASDFFKIDSLPTFAAKAASGWLTDMIREDRLVSHFQPILCADGRTVYGYECLARGMAEGRMIAPGLMFDVARRADLVFQLDLAARRSAILGAARHQISHKVFINFTPNSIYEASHCLDSTVRLVDEVGLKHNQVVFEITECQHLPDMPHLSRIVDYYRNKGFAVALDDIGSGYSSLNVLLGLRPEYVKLDIALTQAVHNDPAKAVVTRKLLETIQELGLKTIAEGVETAEEWAWMRNHGADYLQGFYFARPAAIPPLSVGANDKA